MSALCSTRAAGDPSLGRHLGEETMIGCGSGGIIGGEGQTCEGGQTCGRDGVDFSLNAEQRELPVRPESRS